MLLNIMQHACAHLCLCACCVAKEAQTYAEDTGLLFMETSAKTAMNVNELFLAIGERPLIYL